VSKEEKHPAQDALVGNLSDIERKKWIINRIDSALESLHLGLTIGREQFNSVAEKFEEDVVNWRNAILAAVVFASTTILGISSYSILREYTIQLLMANILIGLVAFIVITAIKGKIHDKISEIDLSFLLAVDRLGFFKLYFTTMTVDVENIDFQKLQFLLHYSYFATHAVSVDQITSYTNASKLIFFGRKMRSELRSTGVTFERKAAQALASYNMYKKEFEYFSDDMSKLVYVHGSFLKYVRNTEDTINKRETE
jgi:hypothetical protein